MTFVSGCSPPPTTHRGGVRKYGAEIPRLSSLSECITKDHSILSLVLRPQGVFNVHLYYNQVCGIEPVTLAQSVNSLTAREPQASE